MIRFHDLEQGSDIHPTFQSLHPTLTPMNGGVSGSQGLSLKIHLSSQKNWNSGLKKDICVHISIIHNHHNLETAQMHLMGEWIDKLWNIHTMECYSAKMNYWYTQLGWISKALHCMKEVSLKRLHFVWFYLYDIL